MHLLKYVEVKNPVHCFGQGFLNIKMLNITLMLIRLAYMHLSYLAYMHPLHWA